jgi:hypothetical protein
MKANTNSLLEELARAGDADVDPIILEWSKAGVFDSAATHAIEIAHAKGNSVTIIENGIVYLFMPDGSKQEVRRLSRQRSTSYTSGTVYIS